MLRRVTVRYGSYGEPRSVWYVPLRSVMAVMVWLGETRFGWVSYGSFGLLGSVQLRYVPAL